MNAGSITAKCYVCGKEFKSSPSRINRTDRQTCSRSCADTMKGDRAREKRAKKCCVCGAVFTACYRQIKNKTFYCSRKCAGVGKRTSSFPPIDGHPVFFDGKYLYIFDSDAKKIRLHRYVAIKKAGIDAVKNGHVHHIDGNVFNNNESNLMILDNENHALLHQEQIRERKKNNVTYAGGNPDIQKFCTKCNELKVNAEFRKNKNKHDGYADVCKSCMIKQERDIRNGR